MDTTKYLKDIKKKFITLCVWVCVCVCFSMHFDFNNKFVKAMRTRPIFQKYPKNILSLFF